MKHMHVEAVKPGGIASKPGLICDSSRAITCAECDAIYYLHYDRGAEMRSSILAAEIITARHPDHEQSIVLEFPEQAKEIIEQINYVVHSAGLGKLRARKGQISFNSQ